MHKFFRDLSAENQQKLCKILSQLITNEKLNYDISYMSAWLLFEIYTKENSYSTELKKDLKEKWQLFKMTEENSLLRKILTSSLDADSIEKLNELADSCINVDDKAKVPKQNLEEQTEAFESGKFLNNNVILSNAGTGLFHIILEYSVQHRAETEVLKSCFKLLQGICASNKKVFKIIRFSPLQF